MRISIDPASLPYHEPLIAFLREARRGGRKLVLTTASDDQLAIRVANHLGFFDEVLASDGKANLRGANKLDVLTRKFGERGFDYAGNSSVDLSVWRGAREAIVVNATQSLVDRAARCTKLGPTFMRDSSRLRPLIRCLRPHQWVKNLIIFVPTLTAHKLADVPLLLRDLGAFAAFCLCASGVYVINDLMDLDADRRHPGKRYRPFAAGDLPLEAGLVLGPVLLALGAMIAVKLSWLFASVMALYLVLSTTYSWWARGIVLVDVFLLAGLYTIRLMAGHAVTGIAYSAWLLMFSMFIFLSLALVKRYVELDSAKVNRTIEPARSARGYILRDLNLVTSLGTSCGYLAVLVLALYVNSQQVVALYNHPTVLLLVCPLLLYWISRVWLVAHRGEMHDDPVVFAIKDWTSYVIGVLTLVVLWLAAGT